MTKSKAVRRGATGWFAALLLVMVASLGVPRVPQAADADPWGTFTSPDTGPPGAIGTYTNGCLTGGVALAESGPGHQVIRLSRRRYYGHGDLIDYLLRLSARVADAGLGIALVADMTQPRGGPMTFGHRSHQSGLDADIWLRLDLPRLDPAAREAVQELSMVDGWVLSEAWTPAQAELVRTAAEDPSVARIFVHPVIKQALCRAEWPDRGWLRVIRPWSGHKAHMHVRLDCPAGSPECIGQVPPPAGDGCGAELRSWFPDPSRPDPPPSPSRPARPAPPLPATCQALLAGP